MVRNYYVRRDMDRVKDSWIKVPELESKLVVHSSIKLSYLVLSYLINLKFILSETN